MWNKKARARFPEAAAGCSRGVFPSRRAAAPIALRPRRKFPPRTAMGRQKCKRNREYIVRNFIYCFMRGCFRYWRGRPPPDFSLLVRLQALDVARYFAPQLCVFFGIRQEHRGVPPARIRNERHLFYAFERVECGLVALLFCELFQQDKVFVVFDPVAVALHSDARKRLLLPDQFAGIEDVAVAVGIADAVVFARGVGLRNIEVDSPFERVERVPVAPPRIHSP